MNIVVIGGFKMRVGDGTEYWDLKHRLEVLGHSVRLREALGYGMAKTDYSLWSDDLVWANEGGVIAYSDGGASYKMLEAMAQSHGVHLKRNTVVFVAVVPDAGFGQAGGFGIWHLDDLIDFGVAFNVTDVPTSYGINPTPAHPVIQSVDVKSFPDRPTNNRYNVDCDSLFGAFTLPSAKHVAVANHNTVLEKIVSCFN